MRVSTDVLRHLVDLYERIVPTAFNLQIIILFFFNDDLCLPNLFSKFVRIHRLQTTLIAQQ